MSERRFVRASIHGRVQGVGFRAFVERQANEHGLEGWVRNRADGSVEALVAGDARALEQIIKDAWRGPGSARVDRLAADDAAEPDQPGFCVLPTV